MWRLAWLCAFALVVSIPAEAQSSRAVADGYTRRVWQTEDGLPESTVQAFGQTPDHYLWIGTSGGLVRFDGERFVVFNRENTPQIHDDSVFSLMVAKDGSLWAGTDGGGVFRYKDGNFRSYSANEGLANGFVRVVYQDHRGRMWVGTDAGLFRLDGDRFTRIDGTDKVPSLAVHDIREDHEGRLWVGGSKLLMFDGDNCREFLLSGGRSASRVKSIFETRDGTLWVGTVSGLDRLSSGPSLESRQFREVPEITSTVRVLRQDREGTLWIGSIGAGLMRYSDGNFVHVATPEDPPSSTVLSVFEDSEQNIWVGLQTGLLRLSRTAMSTFPLPGAQNADFGTLYPDRDGSLWVATTHLYRIGPQRLAAQLVPDPGPGMRVRTVFRDSKGDWWVGTEGHGVFVTRGARRFHYTKRNGLVNDFVRAFLEGRDHSVWIGTDEGISRWKDGVLTSYRESDGLAYFSIRAISQDSRNDIWIGTERGVTHWHDGRFVQDEVTQILRDEKVWTIREDRDGGLWFGTRGNGLFRWRDGKMTHFTTEQGLASNSIFQILEDARGTFWMSGPDGISSVKRHDLDQYAADPKFRPAVTLYGLSDGVEATQMHGGVQPAGCLTLNGEVWFASNRGPVRVIPDQTRPGELPQVVIEQVLVDGREAPTSGRLIVPPGQGRLQIDYAAIRLRSQERIRFRYRLVNFDRQWVEALRNRVAYYTNLPPGEYEFQVQAFEMNMPDNVTEASLGIEWRPHIYRTPWFLALCVAAIIALVFFAYRSRLRLVQKRFDAVLEERNRIAREMHDTVIQGCASASALLEAVVSLEPDEVGQKRELLDSARDQVRATVDEARAAVWNLRRKEKTAPEIGSMLEQISRQVSHLSHVPVRFESSGKSVPLDGIVEHVVLMVAREAVYNAVRHGQPTDVCIRVHFEPAQMSLEIADDGRGFDLAEATSLEASHFGLVGMRERVESLGGRFDVRSAPGQGTRILAELPVRPMTADRRVAV
ncbi:MAG TPA: two-component regulator propeller domain-containing protein [Candidatus Limnocylindrales bacterium]|nr:two-component regulator propeller domain-containing protein [Candidatus Limnocylindrales bacterium]